MTIYWSRNTIMRVVLEVDFLDPCFLFEEEEEADDLPLFLRVRESPSLS